MPYSRLLQQGRIQRYKARPQEIEQLFQVAERDLETANRILDTDLDWAYNIAYNAVLQAARALMLAQGYRPRGQSQHATVVEFARLTLGSGFQHQVALFDQMRRKRHQLVYDVAGLVSRQEAQQALAFAQQIVAEMRDTVTKGADSKK